MTTKLNSRFLTAKEVMEMLRIKSYRKLRKITNEHNIPKIICGKQILYSKEDINKYIAEQQQ